MSIKYISSIIFVKNVAQNVFSLFFSLISSTDDLERLTLNNMPIPEFSIRSFKSIGLHRFKLQYNIFANDYDLKLASPTPDSCVTSDAHYRVTAPSRNKAEREVGRGDVKLRQLDQDSLSARIKMRMRSDSHICMVNERTLPKGWP